MPSKIEWTDETWNFLGGCSPCSPGCENCAAARQAAGRLKNHPLYTGLTKNGKWTGKIRLCTDINRRDILGKPLHWKKPRRIFPCFMGDLFHPKVPFEFVTRVHDRIDVCQQHTFLILTKRIVRASDYYVGYLGGRIPENVHLGVSISNQDEADEKIPILLQIPAAVHWLSIEPMLGGIDLSNLKLSPKTTLNALGGWQRNYVTKAHREQRNASKYTSAIDQVILGGESGLGARPMHPDWVRNIRDQCAAAGVAFFFKQWGEYLPESQGANIEPPINAGYNTKKGYWWPDKSWSIWVTKKKAGHLLDGKEWHEYPTGK